MTEQYDEEVTLILESELSEGDKIKALHEKGFSRKQLIEEFAFSKTTVYRVLPVHPDNMVKGEVTTNLLPATLKVGQGQVITPEGILQQWFRGGDSDGEMMLKGMMLYRAAQMAVLTDVEIMKGQADAHAKMMKPILDMMAEARKEQDAAALRAREQGADIAQEAASAAAEETAARVAHYFDQKKPDIASTQHPMEGFIARTMETMFNQALDKMFKAFGGQAQGGGQIRLPPGWTDERQEEGEQP